MRKYSKRIRRILLFTMLSAIFCLLLTLAVSLFMIFAKQQSAYDIAVGNGYQGTEKEWVQSLKGDKGATGNGISKVEKKSSADNVDTYTITFTNGDTTEFTVTNGEDGNTGATGNGISKVEKKSSADNVDTYTITFTNGDTTEFTVTNGEDGNTGATGNGISNVEKKSSADNVDTYTITFTDNTTSTFTVTNGTNGTNGVGIKSAEINADNELVITLSNDNEINLGNVKGESGRGISSIENTSSAGNVDTYTITFTNGDTKTFTVTNGNDAISIEQLTINRLNQKLATVDKSAKLTPYDRFVSAGITNKQLKALSSTYLYSYSDNEFIAIDGAGSVAYTTSELASYEIGADVIGDENLFTFVKADSLSEDYSNYLVGGSVATLNISTGLDVGAVTGITQITYSNTSGPAKTILIRTNSATTNLTINAYVDPADNTNGDVINHYDSLGNLTVTTMAYGCYYEYGETAFATASSGKLIAKTGGKIDVLYATAKVVSAKEDGGTIGKAYCTGTASEYDSFSTEKGGNKNFESETAENIQSAGNDAVEDKLDEEYKVNYVARIGWVGYETLKSAMNATADGDTVIMLADSNECVPSVTNKSITLDMNGYSLTNASGNTINQYGSNGVLTIKGRATSVISGKVRCNSSIIFAEGFEGTVSGNLIRAGGTITINGGLFDGTFEQTSATVTIAGGEFKTIPTTSTTLKLAAGKTFGEKEGEYYQVVAITAENGLATCVIGEETIYFVSLDDAFTEAKAGGTITLLKDFSGALSSTNSNYYATGDVTLDLNGHTWDLKNGNVNNVTGIRLYSGNLTVKNGTILPSYSGSRVFEIEGGTLTIESGTYYDADRGGESISGSNGCKGTLIINGGTFGTISCNASCPSVTITGGTFNSSITTAYNSATVVSISGGTFNSQIHCNSSLTGVFNISGGTFNCYLGNGGTFNISGGTFNTYENMASTYGSILSTNSNSAFNISGGTFAENITSNERVTIASGYSANQSGDVWVVSQQE